jgi:hypothetical protein
MTTRKPVVIPEVLTIPETAAALKCCRNTVYTLIAAGDLEATDIAPTGSTKPKTRVIAASVAALLTSRTRATPHLRSA